MHFKILLLSTIIFFLFSCDNTKTGLTIVHFKVEDKDTSEPVEAIRIAVNMTRPVFEGDTDIRTVLSNPTNAQGEVDLAFFNTANDCRGYVSLGLSGYSDGEKITVAQEETIEFSITPPQKLVEFHIDSIIDSIYLGGRTYYDFGIIEENQSLIRITNDTVIKKMILPFDTVRFFYAYFIRDSVIRREDTIRVGDEIIQHYIP